MEATYGFKLALGWIFFLLLIYSFERISADEISEPISPLTLWEKIVSSVKNYPWQLNQTEKESPETAHKRSVLFQRLTMATVL
ncbi:hypothetical protein KR009_002904 [Drosophila setifemur]|nr:hypothetical protein KR009_002904 [Drosophila setifemur]